MEKLSFVGAREPASSQALSELERSIGVSLPTAFKSHYERWNGGMPSLDWFPANGGFEPIWIHEFLPIETSPPSLGEGQATVQSVRTQVLSQQLMDGPVLPFAIDPGGNLFCLDASDGSVFYWVNREWDTNRSAESNRAASRRALCQSFGGFLQSLVTEDDAFA
jgi:hypothetical protein